MADKGTMENHIEDLILELQEARSDRDCWRRTAVVLALQLGKSEYALAEYQNQKAMR